MHVQVDRLVSNPLVFGHVRKNILRSPISRKVFVFFNIYIKRVSLNSTSILGYEKNNKNETLI